MRAVSDPGWYENETLAKAYLYLGEAARLANRDPCPSYRRMAEQMPKVPPDRLDSAWLPELVARRDRALERLKSCPAVAGYNPGGSER